MKKTDISEKNLLKIAKTLDKEFKETNRLVIEYNAKLKAFQAASLAKIKKQVQKTEKSKEKLMAEMKKVNKDKWDEKRTMIVGSVTFGLHKVPGGIIIKNESDTIDRMLNLLSAGEISEEKFNAVINTKYILRKREAAKLEENIKKLIKIKDYDSKEELYVRGEEASDIEKLLKTLEKATLSENAVRKEVTEKSTGMQL